MKNALPFVEEKLILIRILFPNRIAINTMLKPWSSNSVQISFTTLAPKWKSLSLVTCSLQRVLIKDKHQLKTWNRFCSNNLFENCLVFINLFLLLRILWFDFSFLLQHPLEKFTLLIFRDGLPHFHRLH